MLRRYTAMGLQSHHLVGPTTLVGSSNLADFIVKGPGVADRHALIEYHPVTRSYWFRDLGTLGGTYCNGQLLYGIIELHSADVLKFGKSAEYVFELPVQQSSSTTKRPTSLRHFGCANGTPNNADVSLPIIGTKLPPHPHREQFFRVPISTKRICQHPRQSVTNLEDSDSSRTFSTINTAPANGAMSPLSAKPGPVSRSCRSHSVGRKTALGSFSAISSPETINLPVLKSINQISVSRNNSSVEAKSSSKNGKYKTNVGNQLLQRVVRLQQEVQRRDDEIARLRENAMLPSISGERVKGTLDEYRVALAAAKDENNKLRMIMALGKSSDNAEKQLLTEHLSIILFKTFFRVIVDELERLNQTWVKKVQNRKSKQHEHWFSNLASPALDTNNFSPDFRLSETTVHDYSDICAEVVKIVQDPFSFRLMGITARCNRSFQREKLPKQSKIMLGELYDNFLKETIHPLSKAIDSFLPIIKEVATIGRESARACILFSQWSREVGDQIRKDGVNKKVMLYKVDELESRFRDNGIPRHWLPPSISPLLHALIDHASFKKTEVKNKMNGSEGQEQGPQGDVVPASQLFEEVSKFEAKIRKLKAGVSHSNEVIEQLRLEKEDLIGQLSEKRNTTWMAGRNSQSSTPSKTLNQPLITGNEVPQIEQEQFAVNESEVFEKLESVDPLSSESKSMELKFNSNLQAKVDGNKPHAETIRQSPSPEGESELEGDNDNNLAEFKKQEQKQRVLSEVAESDNEDDDTDNEMSPKSNPDTVNGNSYNSKIASKANETIQKSKRNPENAPKIEGLNPTLTTENNQIIKNEMKLESLSSEDQASVPHSEAEVIPSEVEDSLEEVECMDISATPHDNSVNSNRASPDSNVGTNNDGESAKEDALEKYHIDLLEDERDKLESEVTSTIHESARSTVNETKTHDANDEVDSSEMTGGLNDCHDVEKFVGREREEIKEVGNEPVTPEDRFDESERGLDGHSNMEEPKIHHENSVPEDHSKESELTILTTAESLAEPVQLPLSEPVEFWDLTLTLAQMLKVVVPTFAESVDEDHTHRRIALELIVTKIQSILKALND